MVVCHTEEFLQPALGAGIHTIHISTTTFEVSQYSSRLVEIPFSSRLTTARYDERGDDSLNEIAGCMHHVRVVTMIHSPKKSPLHLFFGRVVNPAWDLERFKWPGGVRFFHYTSQLGRKLLLTRHILPSVVQEKWGGTLSASYKLRWLNAWDKEREKKEAGLLWAIWHKGVAVNAWQGQFQNQVDQRCVVCNMGARETVLHCFWECPKAIKVWKWCENILYDLCPATSRDHGGHGVLRPSEATQAVHISYDPGSHSPSGPSQTTQAIQVLRGLGGLSPPGPS